MSSISLFYVRIFRRLLKLYEGCFLKQNNDSPGRKDSFISIYNRTYTFYKYKILRAKITKDAISYRIGSELVEIPKNTIELITLDILPVITYYGPVVNIVRVAIQTNTRLINYYLSLDDIDDTETFFQALNTLYVDRMFKPLDYEQFKRIKNSQVRMFKFSVYSWKFLSGAFLIFLVYLIALRGLQSQSFGYQYTSYDENKTISIQQREGKICPKIFEMVNKTDSKNHEYIYECVFGRKLIVLYKKNLSQEDALQYDYSKHEVSLQDMYDYMKQ